MIRGKKGSFMDIIYLMVVLMLTSIVVVSMYMAYSKVNTAFQAHDEISATGKSIMQNTEDNYVTWFDGIYLSLMIGGWLAALILAYMIPSHPLFFFASFIIYVITVIIGSVLGNAFYEFTANANINTYATQFIIIPFAMNNIVEIALFMMFSIGIMMYMRAKK